MKKIALRTSGMLAAVILGVFLWSGICAAAEFKADNYHSTKFIAPAGSAKNTHPGMNGRHDSTAKLYVKGKKEREETDRGKGGKFIMITRKDKGVVWILFPSSKKYMESKYQVGRSITGSRPPMGMHNRGANAGSHAAGSKPPTVQKKSLGKAKVNGYLCDKYRITSSFKRPGNEKPVTVTTTIWESSKLGRPVKIEEKSPMLTSLTELKNIKQTKLSDSMFEIPKGYKKRAESGGRFGPGMGPPHPGN